MGASRPARLRLAHLLDDLAFGGVTRALEVFNTTPLAALADSRTIAVAPRGMMPPRCHANVIVIHFTVNWRRLPFLLALRLRNPGARVVLVEHSYTRAWEATHVRDRNRFRLMLRLAARLVDRVVCVSVAQADWLAQAVGIGRDRIAVIHPHVANPGLAALAPPQRDTALPLRIGAYGRFCAQKGFDTLIRAFRDGHFAGCELVLGGFGEDEADLRELAGASAHIHFTGRVNDVAAFLGGCDVVAIPSRWEAYGMVANEAREAGRPILVAPVDGLPEQAEPASGRAGLVVDFADPASIAAALASLTPAALPAMAEAGRRSTADCGVRRQSQWAALIAALVPQQHAAGQAIPGTIATR